MITVYRADDGTEFYDEDLCLDYERAQKAKRMNFRSRFWTKDRRPISTENLDDCIEKGWFMETASVEEADFINKYANEIGLSVFGDDKPCIGRFFYDDMEERWRNINELYEEYAKILNLFE